MAYALDDYLLDMEDEGYLPVDPCPACEGEPTLLGQLGRRTHLRCRDCGMDYSIVRD
jgi:hypothetical protein